MLVTKECLQRLVIDAKLFLQCAISRVEQLNMKINYIYPIVHFGFGAMQLSAQYVGGNNLERL